MSLVEHPAVLAFLLVAQGGDCPVDLGGKVFGRDVQDARRRPFPGGRLARRLVAAGVLEECPFPAMVEDGRPEEPERAVGRGEESRVTIRVAGRVGHQELGAPCRLPLFEPCALDHDVVGLTFAAAGVPGRQEAAILQLDHAGGVVVLGIGREDRHPARRLVQPPAQPRPERARPGPTTRRASDEGGWLLISRRSPDDTGSESDQSAEEAIEFTSRRVDEQAASKRLAHAPLRSLSPPRDARPARPIPPWGAGAGGWTAAAGYSRRH